MSEVTLKSQHLIVLQSLAELVFPHQSHVLVAFDDELKLIRIAPGSNQQFKSAYKAAPHMLKERNLKGDKSIAIHEILIDHQLDEQDRPLTYQVHEGILMIKI